MSLVFVAISWRFKSSFSISWGVEAGVAFFFEAFCFLVIPGAETGGGTAARSRQLLVWISVCQEVRGRAARALISCPWPAGGGGSVSLRGVKLIESLRSNEDWDRDRTSRLLLDRKPVVSRAARFLAGREGLDWEDVKTCWSGKAVRGFRSPGGAEGEDGVQTWSEHFFCL